MMMKKRKNKIEIKWILVKRMKIKEKTEGETIIIGITMIQIVSITKIKSIEINRNTINSKRELKANKSANISQRNIMTMPIIRNTKSTNERIATNSPTTIKKKETSHLKTGSNMGKRTRQPTLLLIKATKKFSKK